MLVEMYTCFSCNDVNNIQLVIVSQGFVLVSQLDEMVNGLITYMSQLFIHALMKRVFLLIEDLGLNALLLSTA